MSVATLFNPLCDYNLYCNTITAAGSVVTPGSLTLGGNLLVDGTSTLTRAVNTINNLSVGTNLSVDGTSTLTGAVNTINNLSVGGTSTLTGAVNTINNLSVGTNLSVTGISALNGIANITGIATLSNGLSVTGLSSFSGNVNLNGTTSLFGAVDDYIGSPGTAGQYLASTGTQIAWTNLPSAPTVTKQIFLNCVSVVGTSVPPVTFQSGFWGPSGIWPTSSGYGVSSMFAGLAMTITGFYINLQSAPGGSTSWVFTLFKNGVGTAIIASIGASSTHGLSTGSISYAPGDQFTINVASTGSPSVPQWASATITYI
jgi:hypothetical protein